MYIIHWGSPGDRFSQMTATDLSEEDFVLKWLQPHYGTNYVVFHVTPISEACWLSWLLKGWPAIEKAALKLGKV